MSNDKITEVGVNIQEKATVIWNIANALLNLRPQTPQYSNLILIARKQSEEMQQDKKK